MPLAEQCMLLKTFGLEVTISAYFLKQQMNNDHIREDAGGRKH